MLSSTGPVLFGLLEFAGLVLLRQALHAVVLAHHAGVGVRIERTRQLSLNSAQP